MARRKGGEGFLERIRKRDTYYMRWNTEVRWNIEGNNERASGLPEWVYVLGRKHFLFYFRALFKLNVTFSSWPQALPHSALVKTVFIPILQMRKVKLYLETLSACWGWELDFDPSFDFQMRTLITSHQKSEHDLQEEWTKGLGEARGKKPKSGVAAGHSQPWGDKTDLK